MSSAKKTGGPSLLNLEDQLSFYSAYHANPVNKAIHFLCIWPILWTALALFATTGVVPIPPEIARYLPLDPNAWNLHAGTPGLLVYVFVYLAMDPFVGGIGAVMVIACYATSNLWVASGGTAAVAGGIHVAGWLAQFYGHGVHEKRSPALRDNLFQAALASPLFVLYEALFEFGYKAEMYERVKENARRDISEHNAAKARKKA